MTRPIRLNATGGAVGAYIEDVFSTNLYTGNGSGQSITNGIDLAGKGGMVWIKGRSGTTYPLLYDTARGATKALSSAWTVAQSTYVDSLTSFDSAGFTLGADSSSSSVNANNATYAGWAFRKQPKFFDVVTYTGDGTGAARNIPHSLGSVPGCIIIKATGGVDGNSDWELYHQSTGRNGALTLNTTNAFISFANYWGSTDPTSTTFKPNVNSNTNGVTYVALVFAHNAGGFGLTGTDNVISCGSFVGNGSDTSGPVVTLGYEPQFLLMKQVTGAPYDWWLVDTMRGFATSQNSDAGLRPNLSAAEVANAQIAKPLATGFQLENTGSSGLNATGETYIYIAIRRGPMKVPTDGTKVFKPTVFTSDGISTKTISPGFTPDASLLEYRQSWNYPMFTSRLTGNGKLIANLTDAENISNTQWIVSKFDYSNALRYNDYSGGNLSSRTDANGFIAWCFRRAPSFFDQVCWKYAGSSSVNHNLGVVPDLIIHKERDGTDTTDWRVWSPSLSITGLQLYTNGAGTVSGATASSTTFVPPYVNAARNNVFWLFASCPGVSKVGTYLGTGAAQTINCGFTAGARFVLIKRTDSTGDWYVWDTARGIISGNDPYLLLDSAAAEVTSTDYVSPQSVGFGLTASAPAALNASGGTYLFLAIA